MARSTSRRGRPSAGGAGRRSAGAPLAGRPKSQSGGEVDRRRGVRGLLGFSGEVRSELAKVEGRISDAERRTLESVTAQILNKLLHLPTVRMKEAAVSTDGAAYADAVRHLFGLEDDKR